MIVIGLSGSIGMGKSTAARAFKRLHLPVQDSDAVVHSLTGPNGKALPAIEQAFPGVVGPGGVDRNRLGQAVFGDADALARLEGILHPMVRARTDAFLRRAARNRAPVAILDVPLLFESGTHALCDHIFVVSAPARVQRLRVLSRPGMTAEKLAGVLKRQTPDRLKRRYADTVVPTGSGYRTALKVLMTGLMIALMRPPRCWPPQHYRRRTDARNRPRYRNNRL